MKNFFKGSALGLCLILSIGFTGCEKQGGDLTTKPESSEAQTTIDQAHEQRLSIIDANLTHEGDFESTGIWATEAVYQKYGDVFDATPNYLNGFSNSAVFTNGSEVNALNFSVVFRSDNTLDCKKNSDGSYYSCTKQ